MLKNEICPFLMFEKYKSFFLMRKKSFYSECAYCMCAKELNLDFVCNLKNKLVSLLLKKHPYFDR